MQTKINVAQAFGVPGAIYDLTPRRVDAVELAYAAFIGGLAGQTAAGAVGPLNSTYSTFKGVFVRPHEAVNYGTSDGALKASLEQPAGATVQLCSMGRVIVELEMSATQTTATASVESEAAEQAKALTALKALDAVANGATAYYGNSSYKLTASSSSATACGKFLIGCSAADTIAKGATVAYSSTTESTNTLTTATVKCLVVLQLG